MGKSSEDGHVVYKKNILMKKFYSIRTHERIKTKDRDWNGFWGSGGSVGKVDHFSLT